MHVCLLCECAVMSPFLKQDKLQVKGVHWAAVNLHPGFSWSCRMTPRLSQWMLSMAHGVSAGWAGRYSPSERLPAALVIPSTALSTAGSWEAAFATEHKVPLCSQGTNTPPSDQCLRNLEAPWNFYCRCLARTSDLRASKTCSPLPCTQLHGLLPRALQIISGVSNPHSFLFPGQCKCSPGMAFISGR